MAAPTEDYTYTLERSGSDLVLNTDSVLPFYDVTKVSGLDMPDVTVYSDDIDGMHGGVVYARYTQPRTVVFEGTLYADPMNFDVEFENAMKFMIPSSSTLKLWYKQPGIAARYMSVLPIALKSDVDTGRRIGSAAYQLQFIAADPRKYIDETDLTLADAVGQIAHNSGTVETWPTVTINGIYSNPTFTNSAQGLSFTVTHTASTADEMIVDFATRSVTINGVQSSSLVSGHWWSVSPGDNNVSINVASGTPTMTFSYRSGWL